MTTPAKGSVSPNSPQVSSYTLPSSITSVQNNQNLSGAAFSAQPPPTTPTEVVAGNVTSYPDSPGFVQLPTPAFFNNIQIDAVRSAAANTAAAFNLNQTISSDKAALEQRNLADYTMTQGRPPSVDEIIIPP